MADRATASERIALATMAVVAMTMVSQAAATRMRSSPMRDTTSPSQPRRVRHRRDAASGAGSAVAPSPGSGRWSGGGAAETWLVGAPDASWPGERGARGTSPAQCGVSAARPAVGSPTLPHARISARDQDRSKASTMSSSNRSPGGSMVNASGSLRRRRRSPCGACVSGSTATAGAPPGLAATMHNDGDSTRISARIPRSGQRSSTGVPVRFAQVPSSPSAILATTRRSDVPLTAIGRGEVSRLLR